MQRPIPYTDVMINPMNAAEVQHWAKDLQVETYELRAAIKLVGPRVSDLRRFLGRSAPVIFLGSRRVDKEAQNTPALWSAFPSVWEWKHD
jgi:hypothetical protein